MVKKRVKSKNIKKKAKVNLNLINDKLDKILLNQSVLLKEEKKVEELENEELVEEIKLENIEKAEVKEIRAFEKEEDKKINEIIKDVSSHPLTKLTRKDFYKSAIGAFLGLMVHFSFNYVFEISKNVTFGKATFLFLLSFLIGSVIVYATGFRKVTEKKFFPLRMFFIYIIALMMCGIVLFIFGHNFGTSFEETYIQLSIAMIPAIIGATSADLIGKKE